jgi:hypothetical protein
LDDGNAYGSTLGKTAALGITEPVSTVNRGFGATAIGAPGGLLPSIADSIYRPCQCRRKFSLKNMSEYNKGKATLGRL